MSPLERWASLLRYAEHMELNELRHLSVESEFIEALGVLEMNALGIRG